jgi:hypothetical protein
LVTAWWCGSHSRCCISGTDVTKLGACWHLMIWKRELMTLNDNKMLVMVTGAICIGIVMQDVLDRLAPIF